jgi:hypothetical protein
MLQLRRWPNGEHRVVDTESLMASEWLRFEPLGSLSAIDLEYDCSEGAVTETLAADAPYAEVAAWMPPNYDVVRVEGEGAVPPPLPDTVSVSPGGLTPREQQVRRNLRRLMHCDEDDE